MSARRRHRAQRNRRASSIALPRRGELDGPQSPDDTALGAVRKCGSGRSLGHDRQVSGVRGCVGLLADSDLTPTHERRHPGGVRRQRPLTGNLGSSGQPRHAPSGGAGTIPSRCAPLRQRQLTKAVRRISARLRSHQHRSTATGTIIPRASHHSPGTPCSGPRTVQTTRTTSQHTVLVPRTKRASQHSVAHQLSNPHCCFLNSPVGSPRELTALFRRRIGWDDGAVWDAARAGAVAWLMNRSCTSGEDGGARAPSVGKRPLLQGLPTRSTGRRSVRRTRPHPHRLASREPPS